MKPLNKISIILFLLFSTNNYACDVCGCGAANSSNTQYSNYNYIGLSYSFMHFNYKEGIHLNSPIGIDKINSLQLTGQYFITNKFSISTIVPFQINSREASNGTEQNHGLGDVSFTGMYNVLHTESDHYLKLGFGIKLPTGEFDLIRANANNAANVSTTQLGTGSYDYMFPLQYGVQLNKLSLQLNAAYFLKTENQYYFKYGNQTQYQAKVKYNFLETETLHLDASLSVSHDDFKNSETSGSANFDTDGKMTNAILGMSCDFKKFVLGVNYQTPISQNLVNNNVTFNNGLGVYTHWKF